MRPVVLQSKTDKRFQVVSRDCLVDWYTFDKSWRHCTGCPLALGRKRVVQFRGTIPAPILFIGCSPDPIANISGVCLHPNSAGGQKFDRLCDYLGLSDGDWCAINLLGCILGDLAPKKPLISACQPRFQTLLDLITPRFVILMGAQVNKYLGADDFPEAAVVSVEHPDKIAKSNRVEDFKRFHLTISQHPQWDAVRAECDRQGTW